jgi:membrane-associated phospholipid phosphatase
LLFGAIAAFFAGLLPYAILLIGVRRGRLGDRHLSSLKQRPGMMVIGLASVTVGLAVTYWLGAPRELVALVVAMVAGVAVALVVSLFWKISVHSACAAGTVAILVVVFGPALILAASLVVAIAWARVVLGEHTVAQVVTGAVVGATVATGVMAPLM